jgi:type IV pilus assembly protein PilV
MKTQRTLKNQGGMVLIEGLIAIVIFALGILAIIGMQSVTVRQVSDAKYRVDAANAVSQALGAIWVDRLNAAKYAVTDAPVSTLPSGKLTVRVAGALAPAGNGVTATVTVTWQVPGDSKVHSQSSVQLING